MIEIKIEGDTIARLEKALGSVANGVPRVITRSINHALTRGRTECVRAATKEYMIKAGDVRASLNVRRASYGSLQGQIESKAPNLPVWQFDVRPRALQQARKKKRPVTLRVKRGGSASTIQQGFVAETGPHGIGVFERRGSERVPLREFYTIGPASMVGSEKVSGEIERAMQLALDGEIDRQAALLLSEK